VKDLALWTAFQNRLKCKKINIFLIFNRCAAAALQHTCMAVTKNFILPMCFKTVQIKRNLHVR